MPNALSILKQHWNHDAFRTPQEQIIEAVLAKKDCLALLPTGGGKSICFQVPTLAQDGLCLVISPLVALMKDQVENLQKRNIKALAISGSVSTNDLIDLLDNCQFGKYSFLYLSPERLQTAWIVERLKKLPITLIAVDEAHCISQWGPDFRPAYLQLGELRNLFSKTPIIALTASATDAVQDDIIRLLKLREHEIFKQSVERPNLSYKVVPCSDKLYYLEQLFAQNKAPAILYVRNRKSCYEYASQLSALGIHATYYHGGLSPKEKEKNRMQWMQNQAQVMVATNAFGMGIDRADVQTVVHVQLPDSIESYYQEAGRAGRNGQAAQAILLVGPSDALQAENQFINQLPDKAFLGLVYKKLNAYLQVAYGEGLHEQFRLNLQQFCLKYDLPTLKTYACMQFLDRQGVFQLSTEFSQKVNLQFTISSKEVLRYCSLNPKDEPVVSTLMRLYPGIYEMSVPINIPLLAKKAECTETIVEQVLEKLQQRDMVLYQANNTDTTLVYTEIRDDEHTINRIAKHLIRQNESKTNQLKAVLRYANQSAQCCSQFLASYFGDTTTPRCGHCSVCEAEIEKPISNTSIQTAIIAELQKGQFSSRELAVKVACDEASLIFALKNLLENKRIFLDHTNRYSLSK